MEGQEHIYYAMPMRVMGYDYAAYKKQYDDNAGKYKKVKGLLDDGHWCLTLLNYYNKVKQKINRVIEVKYLYEKSKRKVINEKRVLDSVD